MNKVITIGREFGSGGREIAIKVASKLNIPFYDKELITAAAAKNGLSPEVLGDYEERLRGGYSGFLGTGCGLIECYQQPLSDKIYIAQCDIIKELAAKGDCVIVGRCADHVLEGASVNIFIRADLNARIRRKNQMDIGVAPAKMKQHITAVDKQRKKYYEHYTGRKWGMAEGHHLCIDTTNISTDACAEIICTYVRGFE